MYASDFSGSPWAAAWWAAASVASGLSTEMLERRLGECSVDIEIAYSDKSEESLRFPSVGISS